MLIIVPCVSCQNKLCSFQRSCGNLQHFLVIIDFFLFILYTIVYYEDGEIMSRLIIGLTGAFGSGTSFLAEHFFVKEEKFEKCSLSQALRKLFRDERGEEIPSRHELQEFGNKKRKSDSAVLARMVDTEIVCKDQDKSYVIESIRNPAEIKYFREKYPEFILIGVFADYDVRWERVKTTYENSKDTFDADEQKDKGSFEPSYGQKISDCFFESDLILSNNESISCDSPNEAYFLMMKKIKGYLMALNDPANSNPTLKETLMAAAYTSGRRSKCIKRKVGAIIADKYDRIISSGFNGVPYGLQECKPLYGHCYRDLKREDVGRRIGKDLAIDVNDDTVRTVKKNVKLLELCRALHGEESAILNLVGRGVDLENSTIYVTTYPCNLCANKIVQVGIKKVVYFEPYPVEEAKKIFKDAGVESEPFEGVTFRAFFKFFQFEP